METSIIKIKTVLWHNRSELTKRQNRTRLQSDVIENWPRAINKLEKLSTPLQPAAVYLFLNWVRVRTHYSIIDPVIFLCCCLVCDKVDGQVWLSEFCDDLFVNHCQLLYRSSKLCCGNQCRLTTLLSKINVSWNNKVVL